MYTQRTSRSRIGLVGCFGWGNFGDELFFRQWSTQLKSFDTFRANDLLEKPYFSRSAKLVAAEADVLVIGGGDLIRTESISSLYWNRAWTQRPLIVSGVGVAEESGVDRPDVIPRLRDFFHSADLLSLSARDPISQDWIVRHLEPPVPVRVVPDLAFAVEGVRRCGDIERQQSIPVVGLALNKLCTDSDTLLANALIDAHLKGEIHLRILALAFGHQLVLERAILDKLSLRRPIEVFDTVEDMIRAISELDLLYSAKFHGLVVAARMGIPSRSLSSTSKAKNLAKLCSLVELVSDTPWRLDDAQQAMGEPFDFSTEIEPMIVAARAELSDVRDTISSQRWIGA